MGLVYATRKNDSNNCVYNIFLFSIGIILRFIGEFVIRITRISSRFKDFLFPIVLNVRENIYIYCSECVRAVKSIEKGNSINVLFVHTIKVAQIYDSKNNII